MTAADGQTVGRFTCWFITLSLTHIGVSSLCCCVGITTHRHHLFLAIVVLGHTYIAKAGTILCPPCRINYMYRRITACTHTIASSLDLSTSHSSLSSLISNIFTLDFQSCLTHSARETPPRAAAIVHCVGGITEHLTHLLTSILCGHAGCTIR